MILNYIKNIFHVLFIVAFFNCLFFNSALSASDLFPKYETAPNYTTFWADGTPNNVYHIRTSGNDSAGDGSYNNAWASLQGAASVVMAGDLILIHAGTYTFPRLYDEDGNLDAQEYSANSFRTSGTATEGIVIMAANKYPGYTSEAQPYIDDIAQFSFTLFNYQVLDGLRINGGLSVMGDHATIQNCEFISGTGGEQDGNPAMIVFPANGPLVSNVTIRNNSFHDPRNDHPEKPGGAIGRCYAIIMFESNTSDGGTTWNGGYTKIMYNKFYNFNTPTSQEFIIYGKDRAHGVEITYNRFYNSTAWATGAFGQGYDIEEGGNATYGWSCHHNLIYNCYGLMYGWGGGSNGSWYSNVVIDNGVSGTSYGFEGEGVHGSPTPWGEIYNNIFNIDDPGEWLYSSDATDLGWFNWCDYNAYPSTTIQGRFENALSASTNWQQHDQTSIPAITVDSNYFATVADNYPYKTAGRNGDCIGGFTFEGSGGDTTPPSAPSGLSVN